MPKVNWNKGGKIKQCIAVKDQAIKTNYYRGKILKDATDPMCRICGQFQETIDHIVAGCPGLAKTGYLQRPTYLHWNICK